MGRALSFLILCGAAGLAGFGGLRLYEAVTRPLPETPLAAAPGSAVVTSETAREDSALDARPFLPIFGVPAPEAPPPAPQVATAPPPPRLDFRLKGVIATDAMRWAVFSGSGGDLLVREGDALGDRARVSKIYSEGVEVEMDGQTLALTFSDSEPVEVASFETPDEAEPERGAWEVPRPTRQEVIFQDLSQDDILALLRKAEATRQERGWTEDAGQ